MTDVEEAKWPWEKTPDYAACNFALAQTRLPPGPSLCRRCAPGHGGISRLARVIDFFLATLRTLRLEVVGFTFQC